MHALRKIIDDGIMHMQRILDFSISRELFSCGFPRARQFTNEDQQVIIQLDRKTAPLLINTCRRKSDQLPPKIAKTEKVRDCAREISADQN